jgi:integrase
MRQPNGYGGVSKLPGKRRRPWRARVTDSWVYDETKGKAVQKYRIIGYFAKRSDALLALAEFQKTPTAAGTAHLTFADLYDLFVAINGKRWASRTAINYRIAYTKHSTALQGLKMHEIRTDILQSVMDSLELKKSTKNLVKTLWIQLFRLAIERDIVQKNYAEFVKISGEETQDSRRAFKPDELSALWAAVGSVPHADLVLILTYTGLRASEFLSLRRDHINLEERFLEVHGTKTKSARRIVPIHRDLVPLFQNRTGTAFFVEENGSPVTYQRFLVYFWNAAMESVGIKDMSPHSARHSFISIATACGVDERLLKKIAGHSSGDVTGGYTHIYLDSILREIDKIKII